MSYPDPDYPDDSEYDPIQDEPDTAWYGGEK